MSSDEELERLKARRLAEMHKNVSSRGEQDAETEPAHRITPREALVGKLGYRGLEVLQNAEFQFPNEVRIMVAKLGELVESGEIGDEIDGGRLLLLFRSVGLNVRMKTKISVERDGKFVSLSEKLSSAEKDV